MRHDALVLTIAALLAGACSEEAAATPPAAVAEAPVPVAATPPPAVEAPPPAPAQPAPDPCIQAAACCDAMAARPANRATRPTIERMCDHLRSYIGSADMAARCAEALQRDRTILQITHNTEPACE